MSDHGPENDDEANDGWGVSMYNDGKGIAFTVQFTALLKPTASDKKRRKNAISKPVSKIVFVHEDMGLHETLTKIIIQLKRKDLFQDLHILVGEIRQAPFDLDYSIARTASKNIEIQNQTDYLQMIEDAAKKASPAITFSMKEKKIVDGENDGSEGNYEELDENTAAKKKQKGPSTEEINQAKLINNLQAIYRCEDRNCSFDYCWPAGENAKHIHLTHLHLRTWSAAIEAKQDGVDMEKPPNTKIFDITFAGNTTDIATLIKRRSAALQPISQNAATVNFEGLADVIKQLNPTFLQPPAIAVQAPVPAVPRLPPRISLHYFCTQFELSPEIEAKLAKKNIVGPHLLRLITDEALRVEGLLDLGELATVRDAQERWVESLTA